MGMYTYNTDKVTHTWSHVHLYMNYIQYIHWSHICSPLLYPIIQSQLFIINITIPLVLLFCAAITCIDALDL